jgi:hypothetical protein
MGDDDTPGYTSPTTASPVTARHRYPPWPPRAQRGCDGPCLPLSSVRLHGLRGWLNALQARDVYADVSLDPAREFRVRLGLSKVPYGFTNLQSSQNRYALERPDALNSAVEGERDIGAYFIWAPYEIRNRFKDLVKMGLRGSGDYGVLSLWASSTARASTTPTATATCTTSPVWPGLSSSTTARSSKSGASYYSGRYVPTTAAMGALQLPGGTSAFDPAAFGHPHGRQCHPLSAALRPGSRVDLGRRTAAQPGHAHHQRAEPQRRLRAGRLPSRLPQSVGTASRLSAGRPSTVLGNSPPTRRKPMSMRSPSASNTSPTPSWS